MPLNLRIGLVGVGRVAQTLSLAMAQAGWQVSALCARNPHQAAPLAAQLDAAALARGDATPLEPVQTLNLGELLAHCDLVFLTVRDDQIEPVCQSAAWQGHHQVVHCSGATSLSALSHARVRGAQVGGFHPLQIFSDPQVALAQLPGSRVAIEADGALHTTLTTLATDLGMVPLQLPPGGRALYHASAGYAASFLLPVLAEAVALWEAAGLPAEDALPALLPLLRGTVDAVEARGLAQAISGPLSRADVGVLQRHLTALCGLPQPDHASFYLALLRRQLPLLDASGRLTPAQRAALNTWLDQA